MGIKPHEFKRLTLREFDNCLTAWNEMEKDRIMYDEFRDAKLALMSGMHGKGATIEKLLGHKPFTWPDADNINTVAESSHYGFPKGSEEYEIIDMVIMNSPKQCTEKHLDIIAEKLKIRRENLNAN